jgi:SAM-dependent methyltransferase
MRDVVTGFYLNVLRSLLSDGSIAKTDSVLVVCGGPLDEKVMKEIGFADFVITNLDPGMANNRQDVENLSYDDKSFDVVVVHAGLHHCYSPHRGLLEMYRVAKKCIVAFESRDSILMRSAVKLGLTVDYEVDSVANGRGGVADTGTPNFVYRWTEREIVKTISSFDPVRPPKTRFFYDFRLPIQRFAASGRFALKTLSSLIEPLSSLVAAVLPKQGNEFAFAVLKENEVHPWIKSPA